MIRSRQTFINAERNRAKVLEFIRSNHGAVLADVMKHMDMTKHRASQILFRMWELGELRREAGGSGQNGARCYVYFAIAERTMSAEEVFARLHGNITGETKPVIRIKPVIRNIPAPRLFGGL